MSKVYKVVLEKKYVKDLRLIPKTYHCHIIEAVQKLAENPRHENSIKLKGYDNLYRVRVGPYRIIYSISDALITIYVLEIGDRKEVYR